MKFSNTLIDKLTGRLNQRNFLKTLVAASSAAVIDWTGFNALADSIPDKKKFPVVVIGAGLGGLVSAAYLSRHGGGYTPVMRAGRDAARRVLKNFIS